MGVRYFDEAPESSPAYQFSAPPVTNSVTAPPVAAPELSPTPQAAVAPPPDWQPQPEDRPLGDRTMIPSGVSRLANGAIDLLSGGPVVRGALRAYKAMPRPEYYFMSPERKRRFLDAIPNDITRPQLPVRDYSVRDVVDSKIGRALQQDIHDSVTRPTVNIPSSVMGSVYNFARSLHPEKVLAQDAPGLPERSFFTVGEDAPELLSRRAAPRPLPVEGVRYFMKMANGDKNQARQLARDAGYTF